MPEEDKKKRAKKLVVEETSASESPTEIEETTSEMEEPEVKEEDLEPVVEDKDETPKESILIPKHEERLEKDSDEPSNKDSKVSVFWVVLLALFIIASLVGGGMLIFKAGVEKGKLEVQTTPKSTSSPLASPTTTPSVETKREELKVQVLNGTGKAGVAASVQEYLEGLGYKDIETGNADASDFTETEISIKDSKKDYLVTLKSDLSVKYDVADTTKTLSSGNDFDAVVTVGTSTK